MKKTLYTLSLLLLAACASVKPGMTSQKDVDRMLPVFPDYTLAQLNEGKALYETYCNRCHGLKDPVAFNETQWRNLVPDMTKKVNKKEANALSPENEEKILRYVLTMSSAPKPTP